MKFASAINFVKIAGRKIYAQADMNMKRLALERAGSTGITIETRSWQHDKSLMEWLHSL